MYHFRRRNAWLNIFYIFTESVDVSKGLLNYKLLDDKEVSYMVILLIKKMFEIMPKKFQHPKNLLISKIADEYLDKI